MGATLVRGRDVRAKRQSIAPTCTQREVARRMGLNHGTLIDLERERTTDADLLQRIDRELDAIKAERAGAQ